MAIKSGFCFVCTRDGCGQVVPVSEETNHFDHHETLLDERRKAEEKRRKRKERKEKERQDKKQREYKDDNSAGPSSYAGRSH
jgi:hypothetical protein